MLKDVISKLDYTNYEVTATVIFGLSFLAVCWGAFRLRGDIATRFSSIPIDDLVPVRVASSLDKTTNSNSNSAPKGV